MGHFHAYVCECLGGGGESVSKQHFLVVVPQPIRFCVWQKWANHSTWFIFPRLICHFLVRHIPAKSSFSSSVHSLWSCLSGRLTKMEPLATSRKIQKLIQQTSREKYRTSVHILWNLYLECTILWWCMPRWILYCSCQHVWPCGCVFCSVIRTCALCLKCNDYA